MTIVFHQYSCFRAVVTYNHTLKHAVVYLLCIVCSMFMASSECSNIEQWGDIKQSYLFHWKLTDLWNFCSSLHSSPPPKFLNVPTTFNLFCLNDNVWTKNFAASWWWSFNWKLISPNISRDLQKHLFDLCMSQIVTGLIGKV